MFGSSFRRLNRLSGFGRPVEMINMTPFIDIMLVLLIIFMVSAAEVKRFLKVDLPKVSGGVAVRENVVVVVSVAKDGSVYLNSKAVRVSDLAEKVAEIFGNSSRSGEKRIFLVGDKGVGYGFVADVLSSLRSGGYSVLLVTDKK